MCHFCDRKKKGNENEINYEPTNHTHTQNEFEHQINTLVSLDIEQNHFHSFNLINFVSK